MIPEAPRALKSKPNIVRRHLANTAESLSSRHTSTHGKNILSDPRI